MPNAYTLEQVQVFIPGKTWNELPTEMKASATAYVYAQQILRYYLIVPTFRANELAALVEGHNQQVVPVMLISADLVLPFDVVMDLDGFGYVHEFLSGLLIRFVDDSEFPPDTSGV